MFYILNFSDHSFASRDTPQLADAYIHDLRYNCGVDPDEIEVIEAFMPEIRLTSAEFAQKFSKEINE